MVCSPNIKEDMKETLEGILGIASADKHDKYLGLPMIIGLKKVEVFREIEEKTAGKLLCWSSNFLSLAGREVLIKSVLAAIPQYSMTCYKLPKSLCDRLQSQMINFWWSASKNTKAIHWVKKSLLMDEKGQGGIGMRDMRIMNEVFLLKQAWRIISQPHLLLSRVLKGRYFSGGSFIEAGLGSRPSHAWRGICSVKQWLAEGLGEWDGEAVPEWKPDPAGIFSVKSAYKWLRDKQGQLHTDRGEQSDDTRMRTFWNKVWRTNVPNRVKLMVWRLFHEALPDATNLTRRGCDAMMECVLCGFAVESALHTVRDCWKARALWEAVALDSRYWTRLGGRVADWLFWCATDCEAGSFRVIMVGVWLLWNNRNEMLHGGKGWAIEEMARRLKSIISHTDKYLGRNLIVKIPNALFSDSDRSSSCVFCDASWGRSVDGVGLAAVMVRDGWIEAVMFQWIGGDSMGRYAEGLAVLLGMSLIEKLRLSGGVIISDALGVVEAIGMGWDNSQGSAGWLEGCLAFQGKYPGWSVKHAMREDNVIADSIARFAQESKTSWLDPWAIPLSIRSLLI